MGPLALYLYFKYGRAVKPGHREKHSKPDAGNLQSDKPNADDNEARKLSHHGQMHHHMDSQPSQDPEHAMSHGEHDHGRHMDHRQTHNGHSMERMNSRDMSMMRMMDPNRPFWATVLIGVSHCGAGCVLGDLVGEWLVYGTNVMINGQNIWPALLIDYGFALLFGIVFQYFSIAPMSGQYGPKTLVRAAKADILSLTSFELGLFGWMVAYQVGIWNYQLETNTWTYWWMMQVGMIFGFFTSAPVNWYLLKYGIKEPCA